MKVLVFDIGGTTIRAAMFCQKEQQLYSVVRQSCPSHWELTGATILEIQTNLLSQIADLAKNILGNKQPDHVVVAFAGPVDVNGNILAAPTIWGKNLHKPYPVQTLLKTLWPKATIKVINDVTAAGYRYLTKQYDNFCILTVSSGVGHKIFVKGKPLTGASFFGGEIGHLLVDASDNAPICDCGKRGHLGAIASGRGALIKARTLAAACPESFKESHLGKLATNDPNKISNFQLVESFHKQDRWTLNLIKWVSKPLGQAISALHLAVGLEKFILIGGFALALGEEYRQLLVQIAHESCWNIGQAWESMIEFGENDDDHGLLGAGYSTIYSA